MEQEDRKKKLAAGKEKLAAFRKKRAKKKKTEGEDGQAASTESAPNIVSDLEVSIQTNVSSPSDLFSFTGESDHYSFTSGDEWSAEESELQTSVQYQRKLAAASQRIAELEEAVQGKQLALDSMVQEMHRPHPHKSAHEITDGVLVEEKMQNNFGGSMAELEEALVQRDKIIRQLTAHLQEAAMMKANNNSGEDPVGYAEETQRLSQQVVVLQQQLIQAGERVEEQAAVCRMSVQALQEAKAQILVLQGRVVEKNNLLQHLSHSLDTRTAEVTALQHRETDLQWMLQNLQQQAADSDSLMAAQSAASRVVTLEQELEKLTSEHAQSLQSMQQQLQGSQAAHQALASEKELALEKIAGLEDELVKLVAVKDEALRKMSDLERQVQEEIQADGQLGDARERVRLLERQMEEMEENHRQQVNELEQLLAESSGSSQSDMLELKNFINSQKGELVCLQEQLQCKEEELAVSQQQLQSVYDQMDDLKTRHEHQQSEAMSTVHSIQQQMQELREENNYYKQQMMLVQAQVSSFKESLNFSTPSCVSSVMGEGSNNFVDGCDVVSTDSDVTSQIQQLQASYTYLFKQYSELLENSHHIQPEVQTPLQASASMEGIGKEETDGSSAEAAHLQSEIAVQKKDAEIEELNSKLQSVIEEKRQLAARVEQQERVTEEQTLQSDTLQRRIESRVNSLFTEVTEYKEALKESELANIDLQDKLDALSKEAGSLKLQLAASEDLMKDLQTQLNTKLDEHEHMKSELQKLEEEKTRSLTQLEEELQGKETTISQLQEQLKEKDSAQLHAQGQLLEKDSSESELQNQLKEKDGCVSQLEQQLQEKDGCVSQLQEQLQEKDSCVSQLQEQLQEKDSCVSQLQEQLQEKDSCVSQLLEQLQKKDSCVSQLQEQLQEKDSCVSQLQEQLQEKDGCVSQLQEQLQEKDSCVSQLQEQLQEKDSCVSQLQEQLQEKDDSLSQLQRQLQEQAEENISTVTQLQDRLSEKEKTQLQIQAQLDDTQTAVSQKQKEFEEQEETVSQLKAQLEVEGQQIQTLRDEHKASVEEAKQQNARLSEDVECLRRQLAEAHEQHQAALVEQEQLVSQHQDQMRRAEDSLEQKSSEMKHVQERTEEMEALVAAAEDTKNKLSEMSNDLDQKSKDLEELETEKKKLLLELSSLKAERDAEKEDNSTQLEDYTKRLRQAIEEKEQIASSLESAENESSHLLKELQQKLDQMTEQYQSLVSDHQELTSLQTAAAEKQTELVNQLQLKEQEYHILLTENEQLHEELQSSSSVYIKEKKSLKVELQHQRQKCDILLSELDNVQENLFSRDSSSSCQLRKVQKKLKETMKEMEAMETELSNVKQADSVKDSSIKSLQGDRDSLKEKLALAEKTCAELSEDRQQTFEALQTQVHDLEQELLGSREENEAITSRLVAQADMFKVKQEEMVAENNDLNHQLEEVRNDAEETVHQLQKQLEDLHEQLKTTAARLEAQEQEVTQLKEELEASRASLQVQQCELGTLREEGSQHRDSVDSLKALNDSLCQEKEHLLSKIKTLELSIEEIQKQSDESVAALQSEIQQLQEERRLQLQDFDKERSVLAEQNTSLQEQLESCTSEIDRLQQSLKEVVADQDRLKTDNSRLQQQTDTLQLDLSSQMEQAQSELAAKDAELQTISTQLKDSTAQLTQQLESLQEELTAAQSEIEQKESTLISTQEELTAARQQLQRTMEEREMLKSNFDSCMEDMSQRTTEKEATIQQLQGRLVETSQNVDRDQGQLREMYESQLSELEDRLAAADLENQRLEKQCETVNAEKDKLKENYNSHIAEMELTLQAAESESSRLKEQMSKMTNAHDKEMADLKQSCELQLSALEENCQSLEKALAKQDAVLEDAYGKHQRERAEREKTFEHQLSEAYEQSRMYELDINRAKRQLDEMRKDHQKELQDTQKMLENQVFDLENKCVIATSELERMRQSLWGMEQDHSSETLSLQSRIQELEALTHRQEKQMADLQEKLSQSSQQSDDSMVSLQQSYQSDVAHLEDVNQRLKEDMEALQSQVKTMHSTHAKEMEALKHEHNQQVAEVQEKCRQAENYSNVLQLHMENASSSSREPGCDILQEEIQRLQEELAAAESNIVVLKQRLKESQSLHQTQVSKLTDEVNTLVSDKENKDSYIEALTEDLEKEKQSLQESQEMCLHLQEQNKQLMAENSSLFHTTPSDGAADMGRIFVPSEENRSAQEIKQQISHLSEQLQIQMRVESREEDSSTKDKKGVSFETEGGFEPEPDSLGYLDLAVGSKGAGDYFVEESEQPTPSKSSKTRTKSVPCEVYLEAMDEPSLTIPQRRRSSPETGDDCLLQDEHPAGRFEPEDGTVTSVDEGRFEYAREESSDTLLEGFQPESMPPSPNTQMPTAAPNPSFLPHPLAALPDTSSKVEVVSSGSQTDPQLPDSLAGISAASTVLCEAEAMQGASETAGEMPSEEQKTDMEAEVARKLKGLTEQLEEEWVLKMRSQEVELRHSYEEKFEEFKRQTEHQCQQRIQHMKRDTQASFVDAVRKMRKSLEKKQKQEQTVKEVVAARRLSGSQSAQDMADGTDDDRLGDIVKQLHEENQELAEVRDVLLQQIAISQTQGLRQTMQHELQAVVAGGSRLSPHSSLTSSPVLHPPDQPEDGAELMPVQSDLMEASQQHTVLHASMQRAARCPEDDDSTTQSTPTAGSDDDDDDDDQSDGSCVRERFLEELEEMSQQSGQDLPLEWELTSAAVAHTGSGGSSAGMFERDQTGSGSVWEVFDGRCLRQDCREVRHRYNNLFHWLSKICRIPSTPTRLPQGSSDSQGDSLPEPGHTEGQREDQVEGWVASDTEEFDSLILHQIFQGKDSAMEGLLCRRGSFSSEVDSQENKENVPMTEVELLSRLLNAETEKISLEQLINNHQQLFSQERRELQQRGSQLQARCEDLESSNATLLEQLADLQHKYKMIQQAEAQQVPETQTSKAGELPEESHVESWVQTVERAVQVEQVPGGEETLQTYEQKTETIWEEEKIELLQQISTTQAVVVSQREENARHRNTVAALEERCALLHVEIQNVKAENETLQSVILRQQDTETELREKCGLLTEKLEAATDYQDTVQKKVELQNVCSSLEVQLTTSERTLSNLRKENRSLSEENKTLNTDLRELKKTVMHLEDIESKYEALEARCNGLQERDRRTVQHVERSVQGSFSHFCEAGPSVVNAPRGNSTASEKEKEKEIKLLQDKTDALKEENKFLHEKIKILEEDSKLIQNQSQTMQVRNKLLEYQTDTHSSRCEILQTDLQGVKEKLQAAETENKTLRSKVQTLDIAKQKCARLEKEKERLSEELASLKESDSSLQIDCQLLEEKCQALQDELLEATQSSQSLREQLHEQSMTLEQVISEMREENSQDHTDQGTERAERKPDGDNSDPFWQAESPSIYVRAEAEPRQRQQSRLEEEMKEKDKLIREKDKLITELKEQMTALSLQQAAMGSPPALRQSARELEQEVQDLREEVMEKESVIQELQEQQQALKKNQGELKRRIKEDSDLEQEVSILHQALFEKEKVIQELKETSKLLQLSQQESATSVKRHSTGSKGSGQNAVRQERALSQEDRRNQLPVGDYSDRRRDARSSRSVESTDSLAVSSDPDSDISPGQDMDIVREMGRLRKDIKRTKAVYANESALFQEALDREPVSHLGPRDSRSPSLTIDISEMTQNDIPDDSEQLKKIVVKLLEENKCLTTENLRLQLRIREQEALVVEMEEKLQNIKNPPDDWQTLFERQLLLLQKQRDELQHLICERDSGVGLLSARLGRDSVEAASLQQQQEDLTVKIGELDHCHQLLQQRQAELAHCQAEKRHLEQILLLKDETERQLMRQKRLLEEELSTIEGKLQDREATLVEEKAHLLKELKEKEQHIVHLQSSKSNQAQQDSSQPPLVLMGGPQSASTPCVSKTFQASQAYFLQQPLSPQEQDPSVLHKSEEGAHGGSFLEEPGVDPIPPNIPPQSSSFPTEESKPRALRQLAEGRLPSRRHSTGTAGSGRLSPANNPMPRDPTEMYKFHREAVDRLREKLRLQVEEEMAQLTEGQASAITDYWQRRSSQQP